MPKDFSFCLSGKKQNVIPSLFRGKGNLNSAIHSTERQWKNWKVSMLYSVYDDNNLAKYIESSDDGFCFLHGQCFCWPRSSNELSAKEMLDIIRKEGAFGISHLSGNFVSAVFFDNIFYLVSPKSLGTAVYYYQDSNKHFYAATDIRSLPSNKLEVRVNIPDEQEQFYEPGVTAFKNLRVLPSGHYLRIKIDDSEELSPRLVSYWQPCLKACNVGVEEIREKLKSALVNAVAKAQPDQLVSFISGGIDSSIVTMLASINEKKIKTFSIGTESFNEFDKAAKLVSFIKSDHRDIVVTHEELLISYVEVVGLVGHPYSTYIEYLVPGYLAMEKVIEPGETVISGYGSDVLFAGFAKKGQSPASISDIVNLEYRTTLWSNEASGNLINVDGVNIVYPFFDDRVVDIAMSISPRLKFKDGWEKWILRKTFEDMLPSEITWRRKIGIHQTTGIETHLSDFINRNCQKSVKKIGLRLTKDVFTLEILKLLVLNGCQPSDIDFKTICESVNHCGV